MRADDLQVTQGSLALRPEQGRTGEAIATSHPSIIHGPTHSCDDGGMEDEVDPPRAARIADQAAAAAKRARLDALERAGRLIMPTSPMSIGDLPAPIHSADIVSDVLIEHDRGGREQDVFDAGWLGTVGPSLCRYEMLQLLGYDEEDLAADPRLLRLHSPDGREVFPEFQFQDGRPIDGVGEVCDLLEVRREPELETARWLVTPHRGLGGVSAIEALRAGLRGDVISLAAEHALRSTTHTSWDDAAVADALSGIKRVGTARALAVWVEQTATFVFNAAQVEGNTFTLAEVKNLLGGGVVEGRTDFETTQILDLTAAHRELGELVANGTFQLDKPTASRLHRTLAVHEALDAGKFREEGSASGGGHVRLSDGSMVEGVPAGRGGRELRDRYEDLLIYLDAVEDPRLAGLVYAAATIRMQPYFDGNKRVSALMMNGHLMANGYQTVSVPVSRQDQYSQALDALFRDDATRLMVFLATCAVD